VTASFAPTGRAVHLVGSTPFRDVDEALDVFAEKLGPYLRTVPDGETGARKNWIQIFIESWFDHPDLEARRGGPGDFDYSDYNNTPSFRVRKGHRLTGDRLDMGYARAFEAAWPEFVRRRAEFTDPDGRPARFQVGLPGDLDLAVSTFGGPAGFRHRAAFRDATLRDVRSIFATAADDVVFQTEVPVELVALTKVPGFVRRPLAGWLAGAILQLIREAPEGSRWGIHLCLGDFNHRAFGRLPDVSPIVTLSNAIVRRWPAGRHLDFVHAPLAAAVEPPPLEPEFYAPLTKLRLPEGTRFIAGFVHEDRTLTQQRELLARIEGLLGHPVDVACSCGLGRRSRENALQTIDLAASLCAPATTEAVPIGRGEPVPEPAAAAIRA
jgi:hypothetical protein